MNGHSPLEKHVMRAAGLTGNLFRSRYGLWVLGFISFVESALVVPIITDPFLVAYILSNKGKTWRAVIVTTVTSIAGGAVAYILAVAFFEFIAAHYLIGDNGHAFTTLAAQFQQNTFTLTLFGALTPVPYTIIALVIGFVEGSFLLFIAASLIGRGGRYILVGWLTQQYGEQALSIAKRRLNVVAVVLVVLVGVYFILHL